MIAVELKQQGLLISRQLSFEGSTFETVNVELTDDFQILYLKCTNLVTLKSVVFSTQLLKRFFSSNFINE